MSDIPPSGSNEANESLVPRPIPPPMQRMYPPPPRDPHRGARLIVPQLMAGLTIGTAISAIVWFVGFRAQELMNAMLVLMGIKYVGGFTLLFIRDWRMLGTGIFLSIPIGMFIFFSACARSL